MSSRYNDRRIVIQAVMIGVALLWVGRLIQLQIWDTSYAIKADNNAIERVVVYPSRGLILDREEKPLVDNRIAYDVMAIYNKVKEIDTSKFCKILEIDKTTFITTLAKQAHFSNQTSPNKPFAFLKNITHTQYTRLQESLYEFPGFVVQNRGVRAYPDSLGAHLIGYMSEVGEDQMIKSKGAYMRGDYCGTTGLEKFYEKELRGKPGIRYILRDNMGRRKGRYENGTRDSVAISGQDLLTSIDLDVQKLAEKLLHNKRGGVIAVDPSTGEILALASGPNYDPNALGVFNRRRNINLAALYKDPNIPLMNRVMSARYPPGSTFKTGMAALEMQLGWDPNRAVGCGGGYRLGAGRKVKCHRHTGTGNISGAVQHSCNTYFCSSFYHTLNSFPDVSTGLDSIDSYLYDYGFGRVLGVDLPSEIKGNIPTPASYNKVHPIDKRTGKPSWNANTIISMGIGQGEVLVTPLQMVNLAQTIANRGWYYAPHLVKGFRFNGKVIPSSEQYKKKHKMRINPQNFEWVVEGMNNMAKTNKNVFVAGLDICGKTGTAQNPHGKDNSAFISFAPRNNPKIAVAVYVENAGFGAQFGAPIASLLIEQYLTKKSPRAALIKKMKSTFLLKSYTPDTARVRPNIEISTNFFPTRDSLNKIVVKPVQPSVIINMPQPAQPTTPAPTQVQPSTQPNNNSGTPIPPAQPTKPPVEPALKPVEPAQKPPTPTQTGGG